MSHPVVELRLDPAQRRLRDELNAFLDEHLPEQGEASTLGPEWGSDAEFQAGLAFCRKLSERGWFVPHWPVHYGGAGLGIIEQVIVQETLAYRRAPLVNHNGTAMLGPILMRFGSEVQREMHLTRIAKCETIWCQGYSEPDAGSDLGALSLSAVRTDGGYVLNGSKIWTGHARHADWIFMLARTAPRTAATSGITFFLVDLASPGIVVHPISSMAGASTFCQEFFDDVFVPDSCVVGEEGQGWEIAKALLDLERSNIARAAEMQRQLDEYLIARTTDGQPVDDHTAVEVGRLIERVETGRALSYRYARAQGAGTLETWRASVAKLYHSENQALVPQAISRLSPPMGMLVGADAGPADDRFSVGLMLSMLRTIGGGVSEVQRDIIARAGLKLPGR